MLDSTPSAPESSPEIAPLLSVNFSVALACCLAPMGTITLLRVRARKELQKPIVVNTVHPHHPTRALSVETCSVPDVYCDAPTVSPEQRTALAKKEALEPIAVNTPQSLTRRPSALTAENTTPVNAGSPVLPVTLEPPVALALAVVSITTATPTTKRVTYLRNALPEEIITDLLASKVALPITEELPLALAKRENW